MMQKRFGIYNGSRGSDFRNLIEGLLFRGRLKKKYIDELLTPDAMKIYDDVFTSETKNNTENYEMYEQMGDGTANKFIVWYMYRRFPPLQCPLAVKIVARLRINYGAKQSFADIAEKLGFWPYISASEEERSRKMKPLLEDVLEAFIGATEYILDTKYRIGVGYAIVNDILTSIFNEKITISLEYKDLYDSKTRLKELFDSYRQELGGLEYKETKNEEHMLTTSRVFRVINQFEWQKKYCKKEKKDKQVKVCVKKDYVFIGEGKGSLKATAQQNAAANALVNLANQGFRKEDPSEYAHFANLCKNM